MIHGTNNSWFFSEIIISTGLHLIYANCRPKYLNLLKLMTNILYKRNYIIIINFSFDEI